MSNRYYPPSMEEVWDSYEWLLKSKLEEIDYMTRKMFQEMQFVRAKNDDIRAFLHQRFAELWERVADEQEAQAKFRRREGA